MKVVLGLSGGRDSSTALGAAVQLYGAENIFALGFEYGSKHPQELEAAKKIADYYNVKFKIITINTNVFEGTTSTLLKQSGKEVQLDKTYEQIMTENGNHKVDTYVPARNTLFGAYLLAQAESLVQKYNDEVTIILGQHADDSGFTINEEGEEVLDAKRAAYPDCSIEYVEAFKKVVDISSVGKVYYWAPFINLHKWQIIAAGMNFKKPVPYEFCLSCYDPIVLEDGTIKECGRCATCLDVITAEKKAGYRKES